MIIASPEVKAKPVSKEDAKAIKPLDRKAVYAIVNGDTKSLNDMGTPRLRRLLASQKLKSSGLKLGKSRILKQYRGAVEGADPKARYPLTGSWDPQVLLHPAKDQFASIRVWSLPTRELLSLSVFYPAEKGWNLEEVWVGPYSYRGWTALDYITKAEEAIKAKAWERAAVYLAAGISLKQGTQGTRFPFVKKYDALFSQITQELDKNYPRKVRLSGGEVVLYEMDGFTDERIDAHAIPIVYFAHPKCAGELRVEIATALHQFLIAEKNSVLLKEAPLVLYRGFTKLPVEKDSPYAATPIDMKTGKPYKVSK